MTEDLYQESISFERKPLFFLQGIISLYNISYLLAGNHFLSQKSIPVKINHNDILLTGIAGQTVGFAKNTKYFEELLSILFLVYFFSLFPETYNFLSLDAIFLALFLFKKAPNIQRIFKIFQGILFQTHFLIFHFKTVF